MNKRIRKKHHKKTLRKITAICDEYEAMRERLWRVAMQDVVDAYGESKEACRAAFRRYMAVASFLAFSGPLPRFLTEYRDQDTMEQIN